MKHSYKDDFGRVELEPLEEENIESLRVLRNRERKHFIHTDIIEPLDQRNWYERYLHKSGDIMFQAMLQQRFVGACALYGMSDGKAEFGRLVIDRESAGIKGLGFDTTACACKIGFEQLKLSEIWLKVLSDNIAAVKTYEKCGFLLLEEANGISHMHIRYNEFERKMNGWRSKY